VVRLPDGNVQTYTESLTNRGSGISADGRLGPDDQANTGKIVGARGRDTRPEALSGGWVVWKAWKAWKNRSTGFAGINNLVHSGRPRED
jgi:hypothetical protein